MSLVAIILVSLLLVLTMIICYPYHPICRYLSVALRGGRVDQRDSSDVEDQSAWDTATEVSVVRGRVTGTAVKWCI